MKITVEFLFTVLFFVSVQVFSNAEVSDIIYSGGKPTIWNRILDNVALRSMFLTGNLTMDVNQTCTLCHLGVDLLIKERRGGMTDVQLIAEIEYFCSTLLKVEDDRVCQGMISSYVPIFGYIVDNQKKLNGEKLCGLILQNVQCDAGSNFQWTIEIPNGTTIDIPVSDGSKSFKILHLTDIHYDPNYTENKAIPCGEPLCCQSDQLNATSADAACGHWATYNDADSSMKLIEETLKQANKTHDFDYVYFTGDMVTHRTWSTSVENNTAALTAMFDKLSEYFKVPVYPILGNHEAHPVNLYASEGVADDLSTNWLYKLIYKKWPEAKWFSPDDVKETLLKGGYYTVQPRPGLRVVVLNSNVCYTENWWLLYEDKDPYDQLKWLVDILKASEDKKESVHILSHIPTSNCLKTWAREYNKIIERFANTVTGQFYGHSHRDQFYIHYGNDSKPFNVAWNGASVVADKSNPNYKIYTVDSKNYDVLDIETWTFNLTKANTEKSDSLDWYLLYTIKKDFGLKSLSPSDMDELVTKMATDKDNLLIDKYYKFYHSNSDAVTPECSKACQKRLLCEIVNTVPGDTKKCQELMSLSEWK